MTPENLTGPICVHAETPVWSTTWGGVRWVDAEAADLVTLRDDGIHRLHLDDEYAAFCRPRVGGGYVAFGARSLHLADSADGTPRIAATFDLGDAQFNDGTVDPRGRLLAGSMATGDAGAVGRVLRIDADLTASQVLSRVTVSNGVAFAPGGSRAYYVDTETQRIDVFDVNEGDLRGRRGFVSIPEETGSGERVHVRRRRSGHAVHHDLGPGAGCRPRHGGRVALLRAPGCHRDAGGGVRGLTTRAGLNATRRRRRDR